MAITLPSDLVLDVMRGADPGRLNMAVAKFGRIPEAPVAKDMAFTDVVSRLPKKPAALEQEVFGSTKTEAGQPQKAFERMFLRNMLESMLPGEKSGIYGGDSSAGIWRSLTADQLAGVYADRGGIGIAQSLSASPAKSGMTTDVQWPYFETAQIRGFTG